MGFKDDGGRSLFFFFQLKKKKKKLKMGIVSVPSSFISKNSWNLNIDKALSTAVSMIKTLNMGATQLTLNTGAPNPKA